jgi:hypothetical protein
MSSLFSIACVVNSAEDGLDGSPGELQVLQMNSLLLQAPQVQTTIKHNALTDTIKHTSLSDILKVVL